MADEAAYITLLVASERVGAWLHDMQQHPGTARYDVEASSAPPASKHPPQRRCKNAVMQLAEAVQQREAYAEEVHEGIPVVSHCMRPCL